MLTADGNPEIDEDFTYSYRVTAAGQSVAADAYLSDALLSANSTARVNLRNAR